MKTKALVVITALIFANFAYAQDEKISNRVLFLGNSVFLNGFGFLKFKHY